MKFLIEVDDAYLKEYSYDVNTWGSEPAVSFDPYFVELELLAHYEMPKETRTITLYLDPDEPSNKFSIKVLE